ncbi:MAG: RNA methyltransferase [Oscillospiraceae bacterium]|nr:RNA methyltransferase [Oscillospiraceae bacterium]
MEVIRSRQNALIKRFVSLGSDGKTRMESGEYLCAGETMLCEAMAAQAEITCVLALEERPGLPSRTVTPELLKAVSPLQNSAGPVFSVRMRPLLPPETLRRVIVLENVQDPGNVGTVLRTADAFGIDLVVLCGACADPYNPKTVRATMGAIFRQPVVKVELSGLKELLGGLPLYGAALSPAAMDIRRLPPPPVAVAIGNEGKGLSPELLALCAGQTVIPMRPCAESLNAAVAASVAMWEMTRSWLD